MDTYTLVTDRIIAQLEQGVIPWHKPWSSGCGAISHTTGKPYSLLNQMLLEGRSGEYLTFQQAKREGGHIRKGEKGSIIVLFKFIESMDEETGEVKSVPIYGTSLCSTLISARGSRRVSSPVSLRLFTQPSALAEKIIADYITRSGVRLIHRQSNEAFYRPTTDEVVLPLRSQFGDTSEYYSTAFHELTHSTGHPSRLNWLTNTAHFGSSAYSREELCAELGASYLVNYTGLETPGSFQNNAAYIEHWLSALREDKRFIVSAAGKADKAVQPVLGEERTTDDT